MKQWLARLVVCLVAATAHADEPPRLQRNPFAVPPEFASPSGAVAGPLTIAPENLALHAIIPGPPDRALVSLNGRILAVGDTHSGYTLIAVYPERARFRSENGSVFDLALRAVERDSAQDGPVTVPPVDETEDSNAEPNPESGTNPDEQAP